MPPRLAPCSSTDTETRPENAPRGALALGVPVTQQGAARLLLAAALGAVAAPRVERLYRFHPETGADANEFEPAELAHATAAELAELQAQIDAGAAFYWRRDETGAWSRVERANYAFVSDVAGFPVEWIDARPKNKT